VPGYPVTPAVFLAAAILLLANALLAERMALLVFGIIATGIPVFWIWHRGVRDV
jgi:hypothetical protein